MWDILKHRLDDNLIGKFRRDSWWVGILANGLGDSILLILGANSDSKKAHTLHENVHRELINSIIH